MLIVLSNKAEGNDMEDARNIGTEPAAPEEQRDEALSSPTPSRRAAAIEAAYILEAVRK